MSFGPRISPSWFKASDRKQEVLVISELTHWISHWDADTHRSVRCGGRLCMACHYGAPKQLRVVVLLVDGAGKECLLELRERHREVFDSYPSVAGLRLTVRKEGTAKNSPVTVKVVGQTLVAVRDISRLVETLGCRPVLLAEGDAEQLRLTQLDERSIGRD